MEKKRDPTTLSVHRCRFVDYAPSAITTLAFPPLPLPSLKGKKILTNGKQSFKFGLLAVGHANGNIDICEWMGSERQIQCSQAWVARKTLPGPYPSKVDALAFVIRHPQDIGGDASPTLSDLRLFSSGGGRELLEWDLERSCIRRTISSQGGSIWSIAANHSSSSLALGCEDGTVRILSIANDALTHSRRFDRVKCRILSIAWGPPVPPESKTKRDTDPKTESSDDDDDDEWSDSWLVTGCSDSSLRKWDVSTGRMIERMGTNKMRGERTLVWAIGVLGDGTIISGDSLGMVKFWDSRTCTQLHSFQAHGADVLCMTISPEGRAVYTAGVDQKTVQFSLVKTSTNDKGPSTGWTQSSTRRMHSHDVRALTIWPPYIPLSHLHQRQFPIDVAPILASGGLDMSVVLTPAALPTSTIVKITNPLNTSTEATFEDAYHRKLAYIARGAVRVARGPRLVSCVREAGLTVWRIQNKPEGNHEGEGYDEDVDMSGAIPEPFAGGWDKVLEMELVVHSNIIAHEISDDGKWLVISDMYETKLFKLHKDAEGQINLKRIKNFSSILQTHVPASSSRPSPLGGLAFHFTPDSSKLIMSTAVPSYILVVDLTGEKPRVLRRFDHHRIQDSIMHNRVLKGRVVKGMHGEVKTNGKIGVHVNGDVEMEMTDAESPQEEEEQDTSDEEKDSDEDEKEDKKTTTLISVDRIAVSADGQWLATSDNRARTHIFNLDSISHHCTLPSFHRSAQALAFDPMHPSTLLLAFPDNTIQIFDVETRQFPSWGKELISSLPKRFTHAHDPILGVAFDPAPSSEHMLTKTRYILFWGATWLFKVALDMSVRVAGKKRRRNAMSGPNGGSGAGGEGEGEGDEERPWRDDKLIMQYRPIACCDFLAKDELVVVERPLVDILATLPPAYFKHKYGAS